MHYLLFLILLTTQVIFANGWYLEGDYLLWATKKAPLPVPLVTSASLSDPIPGALGQPGTKILLGDEDTNIGWQNGFRIKLGRWIKNSPRIGIEGDFFMLPKTSHHHSIHTSGQPGSLNVAVPIHDVTGLWGLQGIPGETIFILPGPLSGPGFKGHFSLKMSTQLLGSELNTLVNLFRSKFTMDFIGGLR